MTDWPKEIILGYAHSNIGSIGKVKLKISKEIVDVKNISEEDIGKDKRVSVLHVKETDKYYILPGQ